MKKYFFLIALCCSISAFTQLSLNNQTIWYSGTFYPEQLTAVNSLNDGKHFTSLDVNYKDGSTEINKYAYKDYSKTKTLLSSKDINNLSIDDYQFNHDQTKLLIASSTESIYRHSSKSNFYIYNLTTKELKELTDFSKGKQRIAEFSGN